MPAQSRTLDPSEPIPDGTAIEASLQRAVEDVAWRPAFYRQLLDSVVLVLVPEAPVVTNAQGDSVLRFVQWNRIDGRCAIPCFTSTRTLFEAVPEGAQCVLLGARTFLELARGALLHLNPHSAFNVELTPEDIENLLACGSLSPPESVTLRAHRWLSLLPVIDPPAPMLDALKGLYVQWPAVRGAYLARVIGLQSGDSESLLLALDVEGDVAPVAQDSSTVIRDTYEGDLVIDIVPVGADVPGLSMAAVQLAHCFYVRADAAR